MTANLISQNLREQYEYHGNTAIERTRIRNGAVERDWLYFDSAQEAVDFFNDQCACSEAA